MTDNQKLRMTLLVMAHGKVEEASKMLDFVNDEKPSVKNEQNPEFCNFAATDGVYLVYEDQHAEKFDGTNPKEGVKYVGICHKGNSFAVALKDLSEDELRLIPDDEDYNKNVKKSRQEFHKREVQAIDDYDSKGNTERLKEQGCKIELPDGEYIPAMGCLVDMERYKSTLNKALEYVGGEPLKNDYYWSSSECNANYAWGMNFDSGNLSYSYYKCNTNYVRAVAAFIPF